jgi:4-amino-4-deoxy-L-arabinose transferase-like glycosyltransferase
MCRFTDALHDAARREWQLLALIAVVTVVYFSRVTALVVRGEETRWATGATNMIDSGNWIVPRQQDHVFVDRPPLSSWLMAIGGLVRGKVDLVAIRLPSILAILLTSVVIYLYSKTFLTPTGALAAGAAYASIAQVLQIGRFGENEAVYTLLLSGALLSWHALYLRGKPRAIAWSVGYALAGLAALEKGIQAPVYFAAGTFTYLAVRRDWHWLFCWGHVAGAAALAVVVGAWWIPFLLATDWDTGIRIWTATVGARFGTEGLLKHIAVYPLETFGCLLPWSLLLSGIIWPPVRRALGKPPQQIVFAATAPILPYLSLMAATTARGRYFMPLYPLFAVAVGWFTERCAAAAPGSLPRGRWRLFLMILAVIGLGGAGFVLVASFVPRAEGPLAVARQTPLIAIFVLVLASVLAGVLLWARRDRRPIAVEIAVLTIGGLLGLAYTGPVVNILQRNSNDMTDQVAQFKTMAPDPAHLVSLGYVHHRFAWYYADHIKELPWPVKAAELPADVDYFCMGWTDTDSYDTRSPGPGSLEKRQPGTLPFAWERVFFMSCDPDKGTNPRTGPILARVVRGVPTLGEVPPGTIRK